MIRYVIDASAAAEYLLRTPLGLKLADLIAGAFILAPELLDVEVLSVLRRAVLRQQLAEPRLCRASRLAENRARRVPLHGSHLRCVRTPRRRSRRQGAPDAKLDARGAADRPQGRHGAACVSTA